MKSSSLGHYILGVEGVALLRTWLTGDAAAVAARVEEIRQVVNNPDAPPLSLRFDAPEMGFQAGYSAWAGSYDAMPNPLFRLEEPVLWEMIDRLAPGNALDAACGTGRHAAYLADKGHRVIGVDGTPAMLEKGRARAPQVDFRVGDLLSLPLDTASMDLAVCTLALCHFRDLVPPIGELARVVRPGGRVLISDPHPLMSALGGAAFFPTEGGGFAFVRNYPHTHSAYLRAFAQAGLALRDCAEPLIGAKEVELFSAALSLGANEFADACREAMEGLPGVLIWELVRGE